VLLLAEQGCALHDVAREIVRRYSYSNMTTKAFWEAIQTFGSLSRRVFLNGTQYWVPNERVYRRICDLFMLYATCGQNAQIIEWVKSECVE
jgi:hypothetical protein